MSVLSYTHSGLRYLVLLAGVASLSYSLFGLVTRRPFDRAMRALGSAFAGILHLQILAGFALLFTGSFGTAVGPHAMSMVFAAVVAQVVPSVMRRRPPEARTYAPFLVSTAVALALIVTGIVALGRPVLG